MEEKNINPQESLEIIQSMIDRSRNKLADDGFYFIFWGWLVSGCALAQYFCIKADLAFSNWIWVVMMPLGGLVSLIYSWKENKQKKVRSYIDRYIVYLWGAVLAAMAICLGFSGTHGFHVTYFFLMILYGMGSFATGGLLNFKPLIIGSLFSFAFAVLSVYISDLNLLLCISGALLCSHIVPGHLLRSSFKSQNV